MRFSFCPNCAGISTMLPHQGLLKCSRCNYVGKPEEGTAESINALSKRIKAGISPLSAAQPQQQAQAKQDARAMDAIKESALSKDSNAKKIDIIVDERLRSLKGKKDSNSEFL